MGAGRGQIRKGPGVTVRSAPWPSNRSSYNAGVGGTAGGHTELALRPPWSPGLCRPAKCSVSCTISGSQI